MPRASGNGGESAARSAGLVYAQPGARSIERVRAGAGFRFVAPGGRVVRDAATLARIRRLAIPPAWRDVRIAVSPRAHIQATGTDARGRRQYRYHAEWRRVRDETKYHRCLAFARALPAIRRRVERDLARPGLPREKVLAAVVRLLETTFIRVGNEEYARANRHYGLTTLQDRHVRVAAGALRFRFRGKSGVDHEIGLADRRLARVVARCQALPGQDLFQYLGPDGRPRDVRSDDVNDYLREVSGGDFTAKDFRTWAGTVLAALALAELGPAGTQARAKRNVARAVETVAGRLGNTPSVCRKCYVHPAVLDAYLAGALPRYIADGLARAPARGLAAEEAAVLTVLQRAASER